MKIKEANVTVMVTDMKRAIRFYVDVVGLELKANHGDQFAQVASPGVVIGLHPRTGTSRVPERRKAYLSDSEWTT
jgi:catechol 2,3-dioxygenase-like lactoylglutathione lyase family enzyme